MSRSRYVKNSISCAKAAAFFHLLRNYWSDSQYPDIVIVLLKTSNPEQMHSFMLDGEHWLPNIASFKYNKLLIHVLNGLVLCWMGKLIFRIMCMPKQCSTLLVLLLSASGLLHPLHSTTRRYIVQRMTTLFILVAIVLTVSNRGGSPVVTTDAVLCSRNC